MRNYEDPIYAEVRKRSLKRDKYKCQMPGCKCKKRLESHHIIPWSKAAYLRYDVNNLITLCYACHKSIKDQEHLYQSLFMEIVKNNENNKRH
jgi:5-methylcytosine-specific restriction endonuclease McrA